MHPSRFHYQSLAALCLCLYSASALASGTPELGIYVFALITLLPGFILGVMFAIAEVRLKRALTISVVGFVALFTLAAWSNFTPGYGAVLFGFIGCLPLGIGLVLSHIIVRPLVRFIRKKRPNERAL